MEELTDLNWLVVAFGDWLALALKSGTPLSSHQSLDPLEEESNAFFTAVE
jgi:hypothetical protein